MSHGSMGHSEAYQHIHIGVSKEEEKKKRAGKYFKEVMTENFPKLIQNVN